MHALKDYYGMVKVLEEFPSVKQTFNLVPSMMVQVEEYARGEAKDPFLALALKPVETRSPGEYRLPWPRMHALKDYYGMVKILEEFPSVKQTFNLVPSMMVQ